MLHFNRGNILNRIDRMEKTLGVIVLQFETSEKIVVQQNLTEWKRR